MPLPAPTPSPAALSLPVPSSPSLLSLTSRAQSVPLLEAEAALPRARSHSTCGFPKMQSLTQRRSTAAVHAHVRHEHHPVKLPMRSWISVGYALGVERGRHASKTISGNRALSTACRLATSLRRQVRASQMVVRHYHAQEARVANGPSPRRSARRARSRRGL